MGSWLQTPRRYNYRKSVEPLFAYSSSRGSGMTLHTRINNECPRRYVHRCEAQRIKHTMGHLSLSCFGYVKFSGFREAKTSANKRLLLCLQSRGAAVQYCSTSFRVVQYCSFAPSLRCKGTTKFADVQEKSHFSAIFLV